MVAHEESADLHDAGEGTIQGGESLWTPPRCLLQPPQRIAADLLRLPCHAAKVRSRSVLELVIILII